MNYAEKEANAKAVIEAKAIVYRGVRIEPNFRSISGTGALLSDQRGWNLFPGGERHWNSSLAFAKRSIDDYYSAVEKGQYSMYAFNVVVRAMHADGRVNEARQLVEARDAKRAEAARAAAEQQAKREADDRVRDAAPEMLALLREIDHAFPAEGCHEPQREMLMRVRAAIAKATGA